MKRSLFLAGLLPAALALAFIPALSASAATQPSTATSSSVTLAAPAAGSAASPDVRAAPEAIQRWSVYPRVDCGGFNGQIEYYDNELTIWGQLWSSCGTESVWLSWDSTPLHQNKLVATASPLKSVPVASHHYWSTFGDSYIEATVCSNYGYWHCGKPYPVSPLPR